MSPAALLRLAASQLSPAGRRGRLTILIYHRVLSKPDAMLEGEVDIAAFDWQMDVLARNFNVLPLVEAVQKLRARSLPARAAAITFDDGYADNVENALPVLTRYGLNATFFIATAYLNGGRMWNDSIIEAVRRSLEPMLDLSSLDLGDYPIARVEERRETATALIRDLKHRPQAERRRLTQGICEIVGTELPASLMMRDEQVRELCEAGMGIGAHTATHPILARLNAQEARSDIVSGREYLATLTGQPVELFAYPNGFPQRDYTAEHVKMVRDLGFRAAVSTAWGAGTADSDFFQLPRFTPWDATPWRFLLRLVLNYRQKTQVA
ncbi:MAG: polysaccharide deacetylase family protein [Gammaproteobacteria bacterium]